MEDLLFLAPTDSQVDTQGLLLSFGSMPYLTAAFCV